tara:strand:+ start:1415 stop:1597 length:183 start_codon:yes stop_codon:yes gene_type:complete
MGKMAAFLKKFYTAKMAGAPPWGQKKKVKGLQHSFEHRLTQTFDNGDFRKSGVAVVQGIP